MVKNNGGLTTPDTAPRFVFVMNRNRDGYEVPLALEEAGILDCFITDFYAPDHQRIWLPKFLRRRTRAGLPSSRSRPSWASFVFQYASEILRLPMHRVFPLTDDMLAQKAARVARKQRSGLYAYSSYLSLDASLPDDLPIIDFEYHPHPDLGFALLQADYAQYPEVGWSFGLEEAAMSNQQASNAWRKADAVVCASTMTRKSLEFAGCDPNRITVIPYGLDDSDSEVCERERGVCRFLFVGQGLQRKGLHHLARAWRVAALKGATLTIVSYRIDPGIAAMLDLPGIEIIGYQSREELETLYSQSDVFIMPSIVEGFGLVYLEALRHGCYVVATENTGVVDLKLSQEAATIVPVGSIDVLAETITALSVRKSNGSLNPRAIRSEAEGWRWRDFREEIVRHAICVWDKSAVNPHLFATSS